MTVINIGEKIRKLRKEKSIRSSYESNRKTIWKRLSYEIRRI